VERWSGLEIMHVLAEIGDCPPLQAWLALALADIACLLAAIGGTQLSRRDVMSSWGVIESVDRVAEILLRYGISQS